MVAALLSVGFIAAMLIWPIGAMIYRSFEVGGFAAEGSGAGVVEIISRPFVRRVVWFTAWQAAVSTAATLVLGVPLAYVLARIDFVGKTLLRAAIVVPFVLPTVVVAGAVEAALGSLPQSLGLDSPIVAIVYAHVFFNVAVVARLVSGFWSQIDDGQIESAAMLGASPWQAWRSVTLSQLWPVLVGSSVLVYLFCFTSYGVIRVLGGLRLVTLETEIHRYAVARGEFDVAAVLALLQVTFVVGFALVAARFQRRQSVAVTTVAGGGASGRSVSAGRRRLIVALAVTLVLLLQGMPVVSLVYRSIRVDQTFGLTYYRGLFSRLDVLPVPAVEAMWNSVVFAAIAVAIALVVGIAAAVVICSGTRLGKWLETLTLVPLGISAVTLGFGYLVGFSAFDLRQSIWLVPAAHAVIGLPFVVASMTAALRSIEPSVREAAMVLGADPARVWRTVDWPLARKGAMTGAGFAAAVSIGEFGATSFLARGQDSFTAPMAVFRLLSTPGSALQGQAMALSVILGVVVGAIAMALEWRRSDSGGLL